MSSTTKRSSRSGSGSGSNKSTSSKGGKEIKWTDWDWDEKYQREFRGLRNKDGTWDYQYRYPEQENAPSKEIPRRLGLGPVQEEGAGIPVTSSAQSQDQSTASVSEGGSNYTTAVASQHTSQTQALDRAFDNIQLSSNPALDNNAGYGRGTMDQPFLQSQNIRNPPGYNYGTTQMPSVMYGMGPSVSSPPTQSFAEPPTTSHESSPPQFPSVTTDTIEAARYISKSTQEESGLPDETLHKEFKVYNSKHFKLGMVFKILWTEPKGQGGAVHTKGTDVQVFETKYGEEYYSSIRRFVIVREDEGHCLCVYQATNKPGVKPQKHAIIYTDSKKKKSGAPKEAPGEVKLQNKPIRMEPKTSRDQLHPSSRLNYAKIYTVEHNVKVCFIGKIHESSMKEFIKTYNHEHRPIPEGDNVEYDDDGDGEEDEQYSEERETAASLS